MNRKDRRRIAKVQTGESLGELKRRAELTDEAQATALTISPEKARELLGKFAAQPGRTQADVDALNKALVDAKRQGDEWMAKIKPLLQPHIEAVAMDSASNPDMEAMVLQFKLMPENRIFKMSQAITGPDGNLRDIDWCLQRLAGVVNNIREALAAKDGTSKGTTLQ